MLKWLHPVMMTGLLVACWLGYYWPHYPANVPLYGHVMVACVYIAALYFLDKVYHALAVGLIRVGELVYSQSLALMICNFLAYLAGCLFFHNYINPWPLFATFLIQFAFCMIWSLLANRIYYANYPAPKTVVLYKTDADLAQIRALGQFEQRFHVIAAIRETESNEAAILNELRGAQAVFAAGIDYALLGHVSKYCMENGMKTYFLPQLEDIIMTGAEYMPMFSEPVMKIQRVQRNTGYLATKRAIDLVASALGLIVVSPFMILTALAVKLYDGGPVFYKQKRLTLNGQEFSILKFRSMNANAEKDGVARLASQNDSRITPVGRFIRATRIDELPQLINILKGDMSLVGPRPERPEIAAQYEEFLPEFSLRLQVRAGLTGMAQVYGRYNTDPRNKLKMDLIYINKLSFLTDFRLILATVKILFLKDSTAGVPQGQKTAAEASERQKKSA